ncbi:glycosyltransferase [Flavobacterium sp. JLP]|uniref:glycosyltransferase family 2 protein n=1 Tax=Flavobacterium sp. JLP TaxID=2783793 RepID=UPI00188AD311|nr:glycosyltransferase [Flavobacterium sp. JLP]MBF4507144.1 glycosyltransferase [Flavobacterium sp. JLP]
MEKNKDFFVTVWMVAYKHENFIEQAIESVMMQRTNFKYQLFIGEDNSPDETRRICEKIQIKYKDKIKLFLHEKNIGATANGIFMYNKCFESKAKYIALLEGDDYWTDPLKLQKQVDFLEANPDYVICAHVAEEKNEMTKLNNVFPHIKLNTTKNIEDYIINNLTATCSLMFKAEYLNPLPIWYKDIHFGDWGLALLLFYRSNKKLMILKDCMGVYRVNSGSVHGSLKSDNLSLIKAYKMHLDFINFINEKLFLKGKFKPSVIKKKINTHAILADLYKKESIIGYCKHSMIKYLLIRFGNRLS